MRFHHSNCFQKGIISHIHVETPYLLRITVLLAYWHNLLLNDLELIYGRNTRLFWRDEFRLSSFEQVPRMGTLALLYPNASVTSFPTNHDISFICFDCPKNGHPEGSEEYSGPFLFFAENLRHRCKRGLFVFRKKSRGLFGGPPLSVHTPRVCFIRT